MLLAIWQTLKSRENYFIVIVSPPSSPCSGGEGTMKQSRAIFALVLCRESPFWLFSGYSPTAEGWRDRCSFGCCHSVVCNSVPGELSSLSILKKD